MPLFLIYLGFGLKIKRVANMIGNVASLCHSARLHNESSDILIEIQLEIVHNWFSINKSMHRIILYNK